MTHLHPRNWIAMLLALLLAGIAHGQDVFNRPLPPEAVAYWTFDPSGLAAAEAADPHRALLEQGLVALAGGATNAEFQPPVSLAAILDLGLVSDAPYRLLLIDVSIDSGPKPKPGAMAQLTRLQAVLEIVTDRREELEQAILAALKAGNHPDPEPMPLGQRRVGQVVRRGGGIHEFSWLWTRDSLLIGWGEESLATLLKAPINQSPSQAHRREAAVRRAGHRPLLEAFANLDRLRQRAPDEVGWGSLAHLLRAWGIGNARSCMVHAWVPPLPESNPPLLQLDITWSSRAEPTGTIRGRTITGDSWHPGLGPAPADVAYAIIIAPSWLSWVNTGLGTYQALASHGAEFTRRCERWMRRFAGVLQRIEADIAPLVAIIGAGDSKPASLLVPTRPFRRGDLQQDLQAVLGSLSPPVRLDAQERRWTIPLAGWELQLRLTADSLAGEWRPAPSAAHPPGSADALP